MSRDRRDRPENTAPNDPAAERPAELLTAYVDGVAELPADERRAVERWLADDPQGRAQAEADEVHGLLGRLRALPPVYDRGEPPDWAAMERSIRQAVADEAPRPWWRSWRWLGPAMTCAAAAAVAFALWPRLVQLPATDPVALPGTASDHATGPEAPGDDLVALWLDGSEVVVDLARPEVVDRMLGDTLGDALLGSGDGPSRAPAQADELEDARAAVDEAGVLPSAGMAWVDALDDAALDRAERLLANPPAGGPPAAHPAERSKG